MTPVTVHSLRTDELDYVLPPHLVATRPAEPRDSARMLVMWRSNSRIEHRHVRDLAEFLQPTDALVFNDTAVMPARLIGRRADTGGRVEGLFLHETVLPGETQWEMMLKAGGRLAPGQRIEWLRHGNAEIGAAVELLKQENGNWIVRMCSDQSTSATLGKVGWTPLPPYILQARRDIHDDHQSVVQVDEKDRDWYQTVYADVARRRQSVAAPTAGLHFTADLLSKIDRLGVKRLNVTLHVGPGTFKPITTSTLERHSMHSEWFEVPSNTIAALKAMRKSGNSGRVIAVGTTTVRTLEAAAGAINPGHLEQQENCGEISGMTDLLIAPPFDFKLVDGMLTNFHLPRSTLLALVASMVGLARLKTVYHEAIAHGYRFYSYGDAMLILP